MILKFKLIKYIIIFYFITQLSAYSEIVKKIEVNGNERISSDTIIMFADVNINENIDDVRLNEIIKNLYDTNFFKNISAKINLNILQLDVIELPIIENVNIEGVKSSKINDNLTKNLNLKSRSSFNEYLFSQDTEKLNQTLKQLGYYYATVDAYVEDLGNNKVNLTYDIKIGEKAKIKKISFIGNKIYKDRKLKSVIVSEEYKFWKFISGKKFLNQDLIEFDERLLKNFYLNNGYYNVEINSSFARMLDDTSFELIYNIDAKDKFYFNNLNLQIPNDFDKENFSSLFDLFNKLKGEKYSINSVKKILDKIDTITIREEYKSLSSQVDETLDNNKINLLFIIEETEKFIVEKINIFGNNITQESVIRNQLEVDEGDIYNDILQKKSENNLKSLNFFKNVSADVSEGKNKNTKVIDIFVEEKPTGEITAGAGIGTSGGTIAAGVKENNYLGKGLEVEANGTLTAESFKGLFSVTNPNYKNSDKAVFVNLQAVEIDQLSAYGYKTNKAGFGLGTKFEYLSDLNLGFSTTSFYEKIETDTTASARQKKQEGNYWDTFLKLNLDYDKRNQKFKTTAGYRSNYNINMPVISDTNTLTTSYDYRIFSEIYENNVSSFSIFLQTANSLSGDDIKLSERLTVPSRRLRGFERGKVGPKDGNDYIGGNHVTAVNFTSTLPQLFPNAQNLDISLFLDAANIWGVDYDSSIDDAGKIRSSVGIGVDWFTLIGPLNFSISETITKEDSDITESFRFNIGTTF
tara:strand:+ start:2037 stop:4283 length:2247 start_codon:yes stop_codon:yes gene_type:complete